MTHKKMLTRPRLPESTYRLQFHAGFTFRDAIKIIPYLHALGITHVYASPILKARRGSTHGYDVVDPAVLNPELGTNADFAEYVEALQDHGMGQIVDIVPNHMGVGTNENPWWNDVLENGPASPYAGWFDIAWRGSPLPELQGKVMLPVLGQSYVEVLAQGEIRLTLEAGRFFANYYERKFPISPQTYAIILNHRADLAPTALRNDDGSRRLAVLVETELAIRQFINENIAIFNGTPGDPRSFDLLDQLLQQQFYKLCYWREASVAINYRRFFDVNDLAALCMEREEVFEASHALILRLIAEGKIAGLRIDHPDGLFDPEAYFQRLQSRVTLTSPESSRKPLYVVAEKILAPDEPLPEKWPIHGTTGYDFINYVNGLFIDPANAEDFTLHYNEWIGGSLPFSEIAYRNKHRVLDSLLAVDLEMLARQLDRLAQRNEAWREITLSEIREALAEIIACFPVYRTYISDRGVGARDAQYIESAIHAAIERNRPKLSHGIFEFIGDMLLLRYPDCFAEEDRLATRRFVGKFQQLTAPVTAKGIEDTAFYVFNRFISLNEVGGDPSRFGEAPERVHQWLRERQMNWPYALSPLSTHDTKRSEDVRARLNVLSEMPTDWWERVQRWGEMNEPHRKIIEGKVAPDSNDEYLLYQTIVGIWPFETDQQTVERELISRIQQYMRKAVREAKVRSSWIEPNAAYEHAVDEFVAIILSEEKSSVFLEEFRRFVKRIAHLGLLNSLSQTLLRLTAPGVPDTYQGTELWDFSLVDPDNRRPVDYERRAQMLQEIQSRTQMPDYDARAHVRELLASMQDGRIKLFLTWRTLACRSEYPGLFTSGQYIPLQIAGKSHEHAFAFGRELNGQLALVVVPRLVYGLNAEANEKPPTAENVWGDTRILLPPILSQLRFKDRVTGAEVIATVDADGHSILRIASLLRDLPVALLVSMS